MNAWRPCSSILLELKIDMLRARVDTVSPFALFAAHPNRTRHHPMWCNNEEFVFVGAMAVRGYPGVCSVCEVNRIPKNICVFLNIFNHALGSHTVTRSQQFGWAHRSAVDSMRIQRPCLRIIEHHVVGHSRTTSSS